LKLTRVCSWCCKTSEEGDPGAGTTHGICPECFEYFSSRDGETLQGFLDRLEAPVLVVDDNVAILGANRKAMEFIQKELVQMLGRLGGEVTECAYARHPEGCGGTEHCSGCAIRNTVTATWKDGLRRRRVEGHQEICRPEGVKRTKIYVSTEKAGDVIFLKIETR
jgi:hypothetical protein